MMKKRKILQFSIIITLLLIMALLFAWYVSFSKKSKEVKIKAENKTTTKVTKKTEKESKELSLVMVGDCLIHRFVYTDAKESDGTYNFDKMFTEVKDLIYGHDLAYYNQESNIGGKSLGLSAYPRFNSPEEIGDTMVNLGFNLVSLANNHTMDKKEAGVINSVNYWKTKPGVYYSGEALSESDRNDNIKVLEKNGIKYAFLSYTTVTNGLVPDNGKEYLTNIYSDEKAKSDIDKIKDKADFIIVAMHWGEEYVTDPNESQKKIASYLSSLGVNLIIGNHAHSIQPVQMIGDTLVFYALGNFISAQDTPNKLTGAIAYAKVKLEDNKIKFYDISADLIYTYYKGGRNFKVYPYTKLDNSILNNYEIYYNKYKGVLNKYSNIIRVK